MNLADAANRYIDEKKPWLMAKDADQADAVQLVCTQGINMFRTLMVYLTPVVPTLADKARALLNEAAWGMGRCRDAAARQENQQVQAAIDAGGAGTGRQDD